MNKHKIFIDGAAGTTGLRLHDRLAGADDIELLSLLDADRKDLDKRLEKIAQADLTVLCLPDDEAKKICELAPKSAKICDTSTAHRTNADWVYGLAELSGQKDKIKSASRVANAGCHATGFISLVRPLVEKGALRADSFLSCQSLTGYSGGGKAMIGEYENPDRAEKYNAPRLYGMALNHKHLPEMRALTGLQNPPLFTPVVGDFYSGMLVCVPIFVSQLTDNYQTGEQICHLLSEYYQGNPLIRVRPFGVCPDDNMLNANALSGYDDMQIFVYANGEQILLISRFDNLGKGASGSALQCVNLMLGRDELAGLKLSE